MIISASRRTDIPAFYMEWFMDRVKDGYFYSKNPFNANQTRCVSLLPKDVEAIVFWSKNPAPLLQHLRLLDEMGYRYYIQYTLNDYPDFLEPALPPLEERIRTFGRLAEQLGNRKVIWRYDPVIVSNRTPAEYHLEHFGKLAGQLSGLCSRVMFTFVDSYGKADRRLAKLQAEHGFQPVDLLKPENEDDLKALAAAIFRIAAINGMEAVTCCEPALLSEVGVRNGPCIDADLIQQLFGLPIKAKKDKHQRPGCLCAESVDMGAYNSCGHFCSYCYANAGDDAVKRNMVRHDPLSPFLL